MPNLHDIERRINSVSSTKQITRTMEMVAAAKIRRASERMANSLPWANAVSDALISTAKHVSFDSEPLLAKRTETKRTCVVVVTSDRGLAGGFNSNILRLAEHFIKDKAAEGVQVHVAACGKKAIGYFTYRNITPVLEFAGLSADPTVEEAMTIAQYAISGYVEGNLDEVVLLYNHPKNAAEQVIRQEMLLPVDTSALAREDGEGSSSGDVDFEPSAEAVLDSLLPAYVRTMVYHALIDSAAGEQGARRNAMKAATDNANEMAETLTRMYNRVRQGAITTEINEIVGGAAALED